jgi:hypothetical protein
MASFYGLDSSNDDMSVGIRLSSSSITIPTCSIAASPLMCVTYTSPCVAVNMGGKDGPAYFSRARTTVF